MSFRFANSFRALFVSGGQNPRGKNKTFCAKSLAPRRPARQVCRWFHSLLDHGKSEGIRICVCLHPRRGRPTRRDFLRGAKRDEKKTKSRTFRTSSRFRFRFRLRLRQFVFGRGVSVDVACVVFWNETKKTRGYSLSVSVVAPERGSSGTRVFSRVRRQNPRFGAKNLATLVSSRRRLFFFLFGASERV